MLLCFVALRFDLPCCVSRRSAALPCFVVCWFAVRLHHTAFDVVRVRRVLFWLVLHGVVVFCCGFVLNCCSLICLDLLSLLTSRSVQRLAKQRLLRWQSQSARTRMLNSNMQSPLAPISMEDPHSREQVLRQVLNKVAYYDIHLHASQQSHHPRRRRRSAEWGRPRGCEKPMSATMESKPCLAGAMRPLPVQGEKTPCAQASHSMQQRSGCTRHRYQLEDHPPIVKQLCRFALICFVSIDMV